MARGGYRQPATPAAVSGPGALSARTDGQPVREIPAGQYGDRQANAALQQAAPMAAPGNLPPTPAGGGAAGPAPPALPPSGDVFRPTDRPGEPGTAGVPVGPGGSGAGVLPDDPDMAIRAMYKRWPSQALLELLQLRGDV